MTRRVFSNVVLAAIGLHLVPATAHENVGPLDPPIAVPEITVLSADGTRGSLRDLLREHVTAIQLMFTRCKSICPIEAATLARVQQALGDDAPGNVHLLSLSIDPETDTPAALKAWLERFGARQGWTAVSPAAADLPRVKGFFDRPSSVGEDHSTGISIIDPKGLLVWRTLDLPEPREVAKLLREVEKARLVSAHGSGNSELVDAALKLSLDPK